MVYTATVSLGFLSSIVLLKLAKVQVIHESQMSMVDLVTIFSLYFFMFVSQILSMLEFSMAAYSNADLWLTCF
jgi:hypothetical protein